MRVSEGTTEWESVRNFNKREWARVDAIEVMKGSVQRSLQNTERVSASI